MGDIMEEYYTNLFTTNQPTNFNELLQALQTKVTPQMNQMLDKVFTANEVHVALKQMHSLKAQVLMVCPLYFINNFGQ